MGEQALQRSGAKLLVTHPGVGPVTALATDVFLGDPARFEKGKALASYVGMIPSEYSSGGGQQRLGGLSKQGNPSCAFFGAWQPYTRCAEIRSCNASTGTSWHRRDWLKREWLQLASSGSVCGHVARLDRLPRVLSPQPNAAEKRWCLCGDARCGS